MIAKKSRRKSVAQGLTTLPPDSAKIRMILEILHEIRERAEEKTIIFSQFTTMLNLIQPFLRNEGYKYVRCKSFLPNSRGFRMFTSHVDDGSMRKDQREESLRRIREEKAVKIILISFKAGNTGQCLRMYLSPSSNGVH